MKYNQGRVNKEDNNDSNETRANNNRRTKREVHTVSGREYDERK